MSVSRYGHALELARGRPDFINLINTNFHEAGLAPDGTLMAELFADHYAGRGRGFAPDPAGDPSLRTALTSLYPGTEPSSFVVTASASESYQHIFRAACPPESTILLPRPGYPLFEEVAHRGGHPVEFYELDPLERWEPDLDWISARITRPDAMDVGALVLISPNNPTGSVLSESALHTLAAACAGAGIPLILDEVFASFRYDRGAAHARPDQLYPDALSFTINGASKLLASPDLKVSWILVGGPAEKASAAVDSLATENDLFLNGSPANQRVAGRLLLEHPELAAQVVRETRKRRDLLLTLVQGYPEIAVHKPAGGIHLPLLLSRIPSVDDERLAIRLLDEESLAVHPGYLYGLETTQAVITSFLPPPELLEEGMARLGRVLARW